MIDPYKLLGVDYEADDAQIKKAYHALARRYHPDRFADDPVRLELAGRKMRDINAAYEQIVSDRARGIRGAAAYARASAPEEPKTDEKRAGREEAPHKQEKKTGQEKEKSRGAEEPRYRQREGASNENPLNAAYVRTLLGAKEYAAALGELCRVAERARNGEWHYLAALCHEGMHHRHDAFREISAACRCEPKKEEYRAMRDRLRKSADGFGAGYERSRKKSADVKVEGKRGKDDPCRRCFLRALGVEDGKC